jgi:Na+-driven multidrug efflux pump
LLLEALELWSYEVMAMMSGFLTVNQQAGMSIDWAISYLCIYIPYSFYMSVSSLVGAALGEGDVKKAKETFRLIFTFCSVIATVICSATFLFSEQIVKFYDSDIDVVVYATSGL